VTPADRFTSDAKHLERVAAWLYRKADGLAAVTGERDESFVALTAHQTADTLDQMARDLREYATLYAGRIP